MGQEYSLDDFARTLPVSQRKPHSATSGRLFPLTDGSEGDVFVTQDKTVLRTVPASILHAAWLPEAVN